MFKRLFAVLLTVPLAVLADVCSNTAEVYYNGFGSQGDVSSGKLVDAAWSGDDNVRINSVTFGQVSPSLAFAGHAGELGMTSKVGWMDLSGANSAQLGFWVQRGFDTQPGGCAADQACSEYPGVGADLRVDYYSNTGQWQTLVTYYGGGAPGEAYLYQQELPVNALHSGFRLRFTHTGGAGETEDFWHLDDVLLEQCLGSSDIDHFSIQVVPLAVACEPIAVTIQAHDAQHNLTDAQGRAVEITTSTSRGAWSGDGVTDSNPQDGKANIQFLPGEVQRTIYLDYPVVAGGSATVNFDVTDGLTTETSGFAVAADDPSVLLTTSGLRFIEVNGSVVTKVIPNQVSAVTSPQNLFIEAVQKDAGDGSCKQVYKAAGARTLKLAAECNNPLRCAGRSLVLGRYSSVGNWQEEAIQTVDDNAVLGASGYSTLPVYFNADSRAPITINYPDVGMLSLHVRDEAVSADPGTVIAGSSTGFVVAPYSIRLASVQSNDSPPIANPGTTDSASGAGFVAAGTPFQMSLEVINALGQITPNYGNEIIAEGVDVDLSTLVYPSGTGVDSGILATALPFALVSPGVFASDTVQWSEVGTFRAVADIRDRDYLGAGSVVATSESGDIGRFYPAYFHLDNRAGENLASHSCGAFSYMSEPDINLRFTLGAYSADAQLVRNYDNKALNWSVAGEVQFYAENADDGLNRGERLTLNQNPLWDAGQYHIDSALSGAPVQFDRLALELDGPYSSLQLSLGVTDIDGVALAAGLLNQNPMLSGDCVLEANCTTAALGFDETTGAYSTLSVEYGRATIESVHGSESSPLAVPFGTQVWNGMIWESAVLDSCTMLPYAALDFAGTSPVANPQPVPVGAGSSLGSFNGMANMALASSGSFGLNFSAPGDIGSFPVIVDLTAKPWLRFDWNQDGNYANDMVLPAAIISFGAYRGHDRVIYWREIFD